MKPFTYPQKKWVMATALLAVLAVNVSFNPQRSDYGSVDLAATDANSKNSEQTNKEDQKKDGQEKQSKSQPEKKGDQKKKAESKKSDSSAKTKSKEESKPEKKAQQENDENAATSEQAEEKVAAEISEGKRIDVMTTLGDVPVSYFTVNNNVLAIVPKVNSEGKICETCGYNTVVLENAKELEIKQLQRKIFDYIETQKIAAVKVAETEAEKNKETNTNDDEKPEKEEVAKIDPFEGIDKKCEEKSDKMAELECFKDEFLKALKNTRKSKTKMAGEDINPREALRFYQQKIQKRMADIMRDAKDKSSSYGVSHLDGGFYSTFSSPDYLFEENDTETLIAGIAEVMHDLIAEIPGRFESVRNSVISAETAILRRQAAEYKSTQQRAMTTTNAQEYPYLVAAAENLKNDFRLMREQFYTRNEDSLNEARSNDNISAGVYNRYLNDLVNFNNKLANGLMGKNAFLSELDTSFYNSELSRRINTGGVRGTLSSTPNGISSRTGATILTNRSVVTPDDILDYRSSLMNDFQNSGFSASSLSPVSAENLARAAALRSRMNMTPRPSN